MENLTTGLKHIDDLIAQAAVRVSQEKDGFIIILLHAVFRDSNEAKSECILPLQGITVDELQRCIEYFLGHAYRFVSPNDIEAGIRGERAVMLTFDDGYFNNVHALPLLHQYNIPATFFLSTEYVRSGRAFWWDTIYRARRRVGIPVNRIIRELQSMKTMTYTAIDAHIASTCGVRENSPASDIDRPFTYDELKAFAADRQVAIGNHTVHHALLTNETGQTVREEIEQAQRDIREMTGHIPAIISYPNGYHSAMVRQIASEAGMRIGIGVRPTKNDLPITLDAPSIMQLNRFGLKHNRSISGQCAVMRYDGRISCHHLGRILLHSLKP